MKQFYKSFRFLIFLPLFFLSCTYSFEKLTILTEYHHRGPQVVIQSLLQGLYLLNINYNHNPSNINKVGDVVIVLNGFDQLRKAINWKKNNLIKKLLAGPNIVTRSIEQNSIICSPEIDFVIQPSEWPKIHLEEDDSRLIGKIKIWFAGVDTNFWQPNPNKNQTKNVLVYWKNNTKNFCNQVCNILKKYGWHPNILKYGSYNIDLYKKMLSQSEFAVFITRSESQGISMLEAWAMNIPTFVWNPGKLTIQDKNFSIVSSCPYLTQKTGFFWKNINKLENLLKNVKNISLFSPREWVLNHMTNKKSTELLVKIIVDLF